MYKSIICLLICWTITLTDCEFGNNGNNHNYGTSSRRSKRQAVDRENPNLSQNKDNSYRRIKQRINTTTITTRTRSQLPVPGQDSYRSTDTQRPDSGEFGPVRVTDIELQPVPSPPGTSLNNNPFIYRRYNQSTTLSRGTSSSRIDPGTGQRVQTPILWSNRTWHWSTNRTREYDPDLDGTTLPPPIESFDLTPPPLREPYETRFYPWGLTSCDESSCYPATGNLLVGREERLKASSTCGIRSQERYCILSGLGQRKKCFLCDSDPANKDDKFKYHGIETIVPTYGTKRKDKWWQAENGEQQVSIQLDLEAEFHFTHLMIIFQSFRPAAMLIERSHDFGRTWSVYQYFAHDCSDAFPGVQTSARTKFSDVICSGQYSQVEPSAYGEVIFKVLPPNIGTNNPYSPEVQNLLKMTNLRLNFTKLHTLGDNLLDKRQEIKEKYYYAISKMIVRGSCSCYGHASRCMPGPGQPIIPEMVYGICDCKHNTKGVNCEQCMDFYNDHPWRPAIGKDQNACKRCNCNNHSERCHFDAAVYEASGQNSGGVCDECMHNTMGKNCENCKPYFYRDHAREIVDPEVCQPCDCDPRGSLDDALCDPKDDPVTGLMAGKCHCKQHVEGRRCDACKAGFWDFREDNPLGCIPCSCNQLGTVGNLGCNVVTGECVCKRNVVGRDCNQCAPEFYGLGAEEEGCKPCDCDDGGSYDNNCDIITGQCKCRAHVTGQKCDKPANGYFAPLIDYLTYEGENSRGTPDTQVVPREPYPNSERSWTGDGFVRTFDKSSVEFDIRNVPASLEYDLVVRYEPTGRGGRPEEAKVILDRLTGPAEYGGPCANAIDGELKVTFSPNERTAKLEPTPLCLERGKPYRIKLEMIPVVDAPRDQTPSTLIDSIVLVPRTDKLPFFQGTPNNDYKNQDFERFRCGSSMMAVTKPQMPDICKKYLNSIGLYEFDGAQECNCDPTGSESMMCEPLGGQCACRPNVIGRTCEKCAPGFYGFGPEGCRPCECHHIGSMDNFCDPISGQCKCRSNTYGRQCDECQPGFWNYPNCERCNCNGHTDSCDSKTGVCLGCRDHTSGPNCEVCERGFYGNPLMGYDIPCRPCPCPGVPGSGVSHADSCDLDPRTNNPICRCLPGYTGERCDRCDNNYYGNPTIPGGSCQECQCNGNTDLATNGNCDPGSGECLRCLYETEGFNCERCRPGWFGDATKQQCAKCVCNDLGTDSSRNGVCDATSGQCPCYPNVVGKECDECAPNHWNLASGKGCEACDCDPQGSYTLKCNLFEGVCHCKPGFGGRRCNECQANHWGDPRVQCFPCECNPSGSLSPQCARNNGTCSCIPGIAGDKCDKCARGFLGRAPHCTGCGECFENWDIVIQDLKKTTNRLIDQARKIKQTGTTGAYREEFTTIENKLKEIEDIIAGANVTEADVVAVDRLIQALRNELTNTQQQLDSLSNRMEETKGRTTDANLALSGLKNAAKQLELDTNNIKENMTALQEANVEGAFNLTRDAQRRSALAQQKVAGTSNIVAASAGKRADTEDMLNKFGSRYNQSFTTNEKGLDGLVKIIQGLEQGVPEINHLVCDGQGTVTTCDPLCGGAGCNKCGGISCGQGATTLAGNALDLATQSKEQLDAMQDKARKELEGILNAKTKSDEALRQAILAYEKSLQARNTSQETTISLQSLLDEIDKFLAEEGAKPAEIRTLAEQCLAMEMSLTPDQILVLARQINDTMAGITNIAGILVETAGPMARANVLKGRADAAKLRADEILDTAKQVLDALQRAKEAQDKAQEAIRKATRDIDGTQGDLTLIATESEAAAALSAKAAEELAKLQDRLDNLKKKFTQNELNVRTAAKEAELAGKLAENAANNATALESRFATAKAALDQKAKDSGANKQRAERLRERAEAIAKAATIKFQELQSIEDEFDENERKMKNYQKIIDELNNQMKGHLDEIEKKAEFHRRCVP